MKNEIYQILQKVQNGEQSIGEAQAELLFIFSVVRPKPDCPHCKGSGGVQTGDMEYSTCPCLRGFGEPLKSEGEEKGVSDCHDETHVTIRDGDFEWCMACSRQIKRAEH